MKYIYARPTLTYKTQKTSYRSNLFTKLLLRLNINVFFTLEVSARDVGHQGVELVGTVLIFVVLSWQLDTDAIRDIPYTLGPQESSKLQISEVLTYSLRRTLMRTSSVPIIFCANFFTSLMARGARLLNPRPWMRRWILMVYSRVAVSLRVVRRVFFWFRAIAKNNTPSRKFQSNRVG